MELDILWRGLAWPLMRLIFFISLGLFVGNLIESLNWTHKVARFAAPLARLGRLKDISAASFSMAFFSGVAANTMLAEAHERQDLNDRELVLSNLFNSLPTYFLHLPTIFFIAAPFIGGAAVIYVGLTAFSAVLRTAFIVFMGYLFLPPIDPGCIPCRLEEHAQQDMSGALSKTLKRFKKRLPKILKFTLPIYVLFFFLRQFGVFDVVQGWTAEHVSLFSWLPPEALGIVTFHIAAEFTAGLAAASALIQSGGLETKQLVLALLLGNILSTPMRALRHQFPYYAGIFKPRMAGKLIIYNQTLRTSSLVVVGLAYYFLG